MNILVLGSRGNISFRFVSHALAMGCHVTTVSRGSGHSARRGFQHANRKDLFVDARLTNQLAELFSKNTYDVVVDFICYNALDAESRVSIFSGNIGRYIFISTTASYSKNPVHLPYTEQTPVDSLNWDYCRDKVDAENVFFKAREDEAFPVIVARLAHTYDTVVPVAVGPADWTVPKRILDGKSVVVHGDGTTLWTLTHAMDVATALLGLCDNERAIGEIYNIVSQARMTWNDITLDLFKVLEMPPSICYVPSFKIYEVSSYLGNGIIWHKRWNDFYDNGKIVKTLGNWVPKIDFKPGLASTVEWYRGSGERQHVSKELDAVLDNLCSINSESKYESD